MILIVDDKKENLFSLKTLLELHRYQVDTASSGDDALKKILKQYYALIILDVQMPGMDGYEVAETITGFSKTKDIPIIFLSAVNLDKRFITKGYESGAVDYVTKPFDPDLLLLKVRTFYRLSMQSRELQDIRNNLQLKVEERTKELLESNKELERNNTELQQYASLASHDLQEPLRKIITFSHLIEEKCLPATPDAKPYIDKLISSSERMRDLINDLLNYSKLSVSAQFSFCPLAGILQDAINDLELAVKETNATVEIGQMYSAEVIPGQFRQVFQNIVSNALKFSKENLPPKIKIWSEIVSDVSISSPITPNGEFIRINIQDNGIGFNEMYLEKIFTLFQRLHGREQYAGTGIGLAIVKKIIEKHDGIISAKSREGEGTTFILVLPIRHVAATTS